MIFDEPLRRRIIIRSRQLRTEQTECERLFWEIVRKKRSHGLRFLRQHPIGHDYGTIKRYFIADFYCAEQRLIVEIDGSVHKTQKEYDKLRTDILAANGCRVIRFYNSEVMDSKKVIHKLNKVLFF